MSSSASPSPFAFNLSQIRVFPMSYLWPEYWNFSINTSNEYSRLVSFRIDWFDVLAIQGILKNLLQHHNSKVSILQCLTFFKHFPGGSDGKAYAYNARDLGSIPVSGRSSGAGNRNPLQYSCLENPMDTEAW